MTTQITVLGLGQIGTSIGLALAGNKTTITRIGNDRETLVARQAEKLGAFDKVVINLHNAVENSDMIVLALPVGEIEETLKVILDDIKPGAVIIDTSPVKAALSEMAQNLLGRDRYFVTMSSGLNPVYLDEDETGPEAAHADLFKNSQMAITAPPNTHPGAIELATDLATLLGGTPFYVDPYEADGLAAAVHTLPLLASAALLRATQDQPGWREGRKLAGKPYAQATRSALMLAGKDSYGQEALLNSENVMRLLDDLIANLQNERDMIERGDSEGLHQYLTQAQEGRETWLKQRSSANWESRGTPPPPTMGQVLGHLVGLRPKKDKK